MPRVLVADTYRLLLRIKFYSSALLPGRWLQCPLEGLHRAGNPPLKNRSPYKERSRSAHRCTKRDSYIFTTIFHGRLSISAFPNRSQSQMKETLVTLLDLYFVKMNLL